ncbi:MAG: GGDEF domain-containing protein [Solirubrobacteraceae bacterium]|nr:GGDEF domain-containing protein [Patulibacter sp.]
MLSSFRPPTRTTPIPSDLPVEAGSIIRWRFLAIGMLVAGALAVEIGLAAGWARSTWPVSVHVSAALLALLALILSRIEIESYLGFTRLVILVSIAVITALEGTLRGLQLIPIFYVWPLLGAAYLLSREELMVCFVIVASACAVALSAAHPDQSFPVGDYAMLVIVGVVVVATTRGLAESLGTTIGSLRHTSETDPLTGLLNRRSFQERLDHHYERATATGMPLTALLLDIDHFKRINDQFGHAAGDAALKRFTELLKDSCRTSDLVARVGGEEFAVVMPGATVPQAIARAEQFSGILREDDEVDGVKMTVSVGVAACDHTNDTWEELLAAADAAVYRAKRAGRDRVVLAEPALGIVPEPVPS